MTEEEIQEALQRLAWILSGADRPDVADTAVHVWRHQPREWSDRLIRAYLPGFDAEIYAEWEAAEANR
jgi:hypothetical protein